MTKIKEIIPVIHYINVDQVLTNVDICLSLGLNKVFLINHEHGYEGVGNLNHCIKEVQDKHPFLWIGVNYLQLDNEEALQVAEQRHVNALWCDNAGIFSKNDESEARLFHTIQGITSPIEYFGGVEFKYQKQPKKEDLKDVYDIASKYVDVICTTGDATNVAINIEKLKRIRETVGKEKLIAVASGINSMNIKEISQYANYYMVASSIVEPRTEIILKDRLKELIKQLS